MFTEQQLKAAHAKVKTGADFPGYIREIKKLGLVTYDFMVTNGQTVYHGKDQQIDSAPIYEAMDIAVQSSPLQLRHNIAVHQQGQTDFMTFCRQAADAGVEKWVIDTRKMMCTYYNLAGIEIVAEPIPDAGY